MNIRKSLALACLATLILAGCKSKEDNTFWLGADVSTANGMLERGQKLKSWEGDQEYDLVPLMKELGLNAVRFRVWVNPRPFRWGPQQEGAEYSHAGLCDKEDVLANCLKAKECGMEIMLCFHYADTWADPGHQPIPEAWYGHSYEQMKEDLKAHTIEVLQLLKDNGIEPKWSQIGNETRNGLLWNTSAYSYTRGKELTEADSMGHSVKNPEQYAGFLQAGYEAAKSVFPNMTCIVHLDNGFDQDMYDWNLGILEKYGVQYDMVGMSLYPYWAAEGSGRTDADGVIEDCAKNIKHVYERFGKESMIVETGFMDTPDPEVLEESYRQFCKAIHEARYNTDGHCHGIFYWAPESRPGGYQLGAFGSDGRPTKIMKAYTDVQ